jgi:hypothetical protein
MEQSPQHVVGGITGNAQCAAFYGSTFFLGEVGSEGSSNASQLIIGPAAHPSSVHFFNGTLTNNGNVQISHEKRIIHVPCDLPFILLVGFGPTAQFDPGGWDQRVFTSAAFVASSETPVVDLGNVQLIGRIDRGPVVRDTSKLHRWIDRVDNQVGHNEQRDQTRKASAAFGIGKAEIGQMRGNEIAQATKRLKLLLTLRREFAFRQTV